MVRVRHRHAGTAEQVGAAALVERVCHVEPRVPRRGGGGSSTCAISGQAKAAARASHGVADVVVVPVGDEDGVDALGLELSRRAARVAVDQSRWRCGRPPACRAGRPRGRAR